ncbi:interleukin-1 receptor-associated kinase 1 isoform X2 [Notolabrus celidotus]|uniref:interleukin-1 receptor-associated kinase 1 isoform X2 n=1 Tax=Notolabrus celidotus TaxID=1203425 RepID=UPI0014908096|nr:interleukin-1 receptor-associated kinase 1 isoform X2 [Notolabrus celidotus]
MAAGGPFLYDLPASVLCEFCWIMDGLSDLDWTRFASEVLCDQTSLRLAERRERRTEWVMNQWGNRNGRVEELVHLLERLQLLRPRDVIQTWTSSLRSSSSPLPPASSLPQFDPPPKPSQAPPTQSTCRLSDVVEGGGRPLPRPAPPPPDLQSVPYHPPQRPLEVPCGGVMSWSYEEVHAGTEGFSPSLQVGEGGFGVVYRATLNKTDCAVKRLREQGCLMEWDRLKESFHTEVDKLTRFRHPNIVDLLGFSEGPECVCLIYTYMENRSLDDQLHNEAGALSWSQRVGVVEGASRALQFLHCPPAGHKPLIHGDVKSSNILLDRYLEAKLADFGVARFASPSWSGRSASQTTSIGKTETIRGTVAYLPDEYLRNGQLGTAVDVFSFGVVLLEILTGRRALERDTKSGGDRYLKDLVEDSPDGVCAAAFRQQLDHRLTSGGAADPIGCVEVWALACSCLNRNRKRRPSMVQVCDELQEIHRRVRRTDSASSPLRHPPPPHLQPHSSHLHRRPRPQDYSVEVLSQQMSKLGPLEDTYQPCMSSSSSSSFSSSSSSSSSLAPPDPLHSSSSLPLSSSSLPPCSSSFIGPCETDESRGFSQYNLQSQCRSNGSSSGSLPLHTRDQFLSPAGPSESQFTQPSVPTEDQYNFPPLPGSTCDSAGSRFLTGQPPGPETGGPTTGGTTAGLYSAPGSLSPVGSLHSSSSGPSGASVLLNPSKLRLLQKKTLYDDGKIRTPDLLSDQDLYGGTSSVEGRGPEESDELDYLPAKHT